MSWFMAGSAAVTVATSYMGAQSNKAAGIRNANAASKAEGEQIAEERLNATIRNSYSTSLAQLQLGMRKRQLAQQGADVSAASLAAQGDVAVGIASTGSIGGSTQHIVSDIQMKTQSALDQTTDAFENDVDNYNRELQLMVINTDQSAPTVRDNVYTGPGDGEMFGAALVSGITQFASQYASRKMSLGLGPTAGPGAAGTGLSANLRTGLPSMGGGTGLYIR